MDEGNPPVINLINISMEMNSTSPGNRPPGGQQSQEMKYLYEATIGVYSLIFFLSVVGNLLVIMTLIQNKRMRTVTNVFLLNLAISDLLLAVLCMPFTLIPMLIRNFIFGEGICVSIRYLQGVSVGASCFTLVAISMERYFAICRPLHSRRWQTLSHAYKTIGGCWILSAIIMIPIGVHTKHLTLKHGVYRCREIWGTEELEKSYTVFLDVVLLLIPLCLMTGAYSKIMSTLCTGIRVEEPENGWKKICARSTVTELTSLDPATTKSYVVANEAVTGADDVTESPSRRDFFQRKRAMSANGGCSSSESTPRRKLDTVRIVRQSNYEKSRNSKRRVVRMLFVVVVEFFACWTPLYTVQTWRSFHPESMEDNISGMAWSLILLLSYCSACCNPITYCFMNKRFRSSFIAALRCFKCNQRGSLSRYPSLNSKNTGINSTRRLTWFDRGYESDSSMNERKSVGVEL